MADKVYLASHQPALKADLGEYRGKPIYLMNFANQAQNTTIWCYFNMDRKVAYCGDSTVQNYFWLSFEKAMKQIGMVVSTENRPDPAAPGVWVTLKSVTDARYVVEVTLQTSWEPSFAKIYEISGEALGDLAGGSAGLEKRAYFMTDRLIETILTDAEFKKAYFKGVAELGGKKPL
jgi:hypothetical protein